jgi:hypothetical protein
MLAVYRYISISVYQYIGISVYRYISVLLSTGIKICVKLKLSSLLTICCRTIAVQGYNCLWDC